MSQPLPGLVNTNTTFHILYRRDRSDVNIVLSKSTTAIDEGEEWELKDYETRSNHDLARQIA